MTFFFVAVVFVSVSVFFVAGVTVDLGAIVADKTSFPPLLLYNSPSIQCNVIPSSSMANPMLSRVGAVEGKARAQHISTTRVTISSLNPKLSEYAQKHFFRKLLYTGKMKHFKFAHSTSTKFCLMAPNVLLP